jgi:hypothetical protein
MRATVYQPQYFPRLHYINRVLDADVFVALDSAQFTRKLKHHGPDGAVVHPSFQAHTPIRLATGRHLLTVPVRHGGALRPLTQTMTADREQWVATHLRSLHGGYAAAPHYDAKAPELAALLDREHPSLAALNMSTLLWALATLLRLDLPVDDLTVDAVNTALAGQRRVPLRRIELASSLPVERPEGRQQGNAWIAALCHEVGATEYLCGGTAAGNYMDKEFFSDRGIDAVIQSWHCPAYGQQFAARHPFIPNLSIVDLLLNVDPVTALAVVHPG